MFISLPGVLGTCYHPGGALHTPSGNSPDTVSEDLYNIEIDIND